MEGESLFNDATSIVLFEIFFEMVKKLGEGSASMEGGLLQEGLRIILQIGWLAVGNLLLPPPPLLLLAFLLAHWVAIGKKDFLSQGRLNTARGCTYCVSDQLPSGETHLCLLDHRSSQHSATAAPAVHSIAGDCSHVTIQVWWTTSTTLVPAQLSSQSNNIVPTSGCTVPPLSWTSSDTPTSVSWKLGPSMADHRLRDLVSRTCHGHACKIKSEVACRWFCHWVCSRIPDQMAAELAAVQGGKSTRRDGSDRSHGIPGLLSG